MIDHEIPLRPYFLGVGGALLALLIAADWLISQPRNESSHSEPTLPKIRIYSELKGPESVVIDSNFSMSVPGRTMQDDIATAPQSLAQPARPNGENVVQVVSSSPKQADAGRVERHPHLGRKPAMAPRKQRPTLYAGHPGFEFFDTGPGVQLDAHIRESFAQFVPGRVKQPGGKRKIAWSRAEHLRGPNFGWFDHAE
ncbi:hypothetical protein [Bradyrhizobium liaoningense]